jgi:hypothetical protein
VRLLGRYCNRKTEVKKLRDLYKRAAGEQVERSSAPERKSVQKLSSALQVEIVGRYQAGERPVDLAREYRISEWRVQELRKRFAVPKHPIGMSDSEIRVAAALYSQGLSFNKIGARVGRDPKTVAKELRIRALDK